MIAIITLGAKGDAGDPGDRGPKGLIGNYIATHLIF